MPELQGSYRAQWKVAFAVVNGMSAEERNMYDDNAAVMCELVDRPTFYFVSETYPDVRMDAGTHEGAARIRLAHLQSKRPHDRYYLTKGA